jgi:hypothetical protein
VLINKELVFKGFEQPTAHWIADVGQNDRPTLRAGEKDLPTLASLHVAGGAGVVRRGPEKLFESFLGGGDSKVRSGVAKTFQKATMHSQLRLTWRRLGDITAPVESIESSNSLVGVSAKQPTLETPLSRTATAPRPARAVRDQRQWEKVARGSIFAREKTTLRLRGMG